MERELDVELPRSRFPVVRRQANAFGSNLQAINRYLSVRERAREELAALSPPGMDGMEDQCAQKEFERNRAIAVYSYLLSYLNMENKSRRLPVVYSARRKRTAR